MLHLAEKIIDCLASKTIPIYRGCPTISQYFDMRGIITFDTLEDLIDIITNLSEDYYENVIDVVEKNYETSRQYWDYYGRIHEKIQEHLE